MTRFVPLTLAVAMLALSAGAATAQVHPLTNGPDGTGPNTVDSAKGFDGINAVAPGREFLYHPERAGNAAAGIGAEAVQAGGTSAGDPAPVRHHARHRRRRPPLR